MPAILSEYVPFEMNRKSIRKLDHFERMAGEDFEYAGYARSGFDVHSDPINGLEGLSYRELARVGLKRSASEVNYFGLKKGFGNRTALIAGRRAKPTRC